VRGAEAIFRAALEVDPGTATAHEGLAWTYLRLGDVPRAARHADRRRALAPGDEAWREKWLSVIRLVPARREEAIRGYRVLVADRPGAIEPRLRLAELLSWTKGRLGEAIAEYRRALALAPRDRAPRIGLARALAWDGRLAEATRRFDELIAKDPDDPEVLLGRGQIARWSGNRALARRLIERARAFGPKDARVLAELALLELEEGRRESARSAVREALALAPGQYEALQAQVALARARAATVAVRTVYSDESTSFQRFAVRVPLELRPFGGTWAMVEPVFTRFAAVGETLDRKSIGAEVRQNLPGRVQVRARYAAHFPDGVGATHEAGLELRAGPLGDVLELRAGGRQRALVDPPLGYEDVGLFAGMIGSGGATLAAIRERLQIREAHGGLSILPAPGAYVYGEVMYGAVGDGNRQIAAAAGMGLDFLRMAGVRGHELRLKYDFFLLDLTRASDRYFSPQGFQVHTPALEWRWTPAQGAVVGVEGGAPLARGAPPGYLGGILFGLSIRDRVRVEGRARLLDNTQYRIAAGTLGVAVGF
jgi:tetratricopeptide (TPR) repeat protein